MKFTTQRENLLRPLQLVSGVVERKQTLPILSNVLLSLDEGVLTFTATDLETEIVVRAAVDQDLGGKTTVPVRKFQDTCRALPEEASLSFELTDSKAQIRSGKTRFSLTTLPANEFPLIEARLNQSSFRIPQRVLKHIIDKTAFAMATQDVRYYLNGLLLETTPERIRAVATDGHRLAMCTCDMALGMESSQQSIVPRKGVLELSRLLEDVDDETEVTIGDNFFRVELPELTFTTKLVEGKYPDYEAVIPRDGDKIVLADKNELRQCLVRTAILSNEKYRGIRIEIAPGVLVASANNPEQEEACDEIAVDYQGDKVAIGFNVNYLTDAVNAVSGDTVKIAFTDANGSALISSRDSDDCLYVVMPMRL